MKHKHLKKALTKHHGELRVRMSSDRAKWFANMEFLLGTVTVFARGKTMDEALTNLDKQLESELPLIPKLLQRLNEPEQ